MIAQLYRLRWQIELVFKDWKSNSGLHALESANPEIVEGFIWASLCAALIKRALAHWAQVVAAKRAVSTRIAAMAGPQILPLLAAWARTPRSTKLLERVFRFLASNALRAYPARDQAGPRGVLGLVFAERLRKIPRSAAQIPSARRAPATRKGRAKD